MEYLTIPTEQEFKKLLHLSFDVAVPDWRQHGFTVWFGRYSSVGCKGCMDVSLRKDGKEYICGLIITADRTYYDVYANLTQLVIGSGGYQVHKAITTIYSQYSCTLLHDVDCVALASAKICNAAMAFLESTVK